MALYEPTLFALLDAEGPAPNEADGIRHAVAAAGIALDRGDQSAAAAHFIDDWMGAGAGATQAADRRVAGQCAPVGPCAVHRRGHRAVRGAALIVPGMDNIRLALPEDIPACVVLRGRTRENAIPAERLAAMGITVQSWADDVRSGVLTGFVCTEHRTIMGYCFGDNTSGEVVVLALLPAHEGRGIGRRLLSRVSAHLAEAGHRRLFLGGAADPATRSFGFYRHLGWVSTGTLDPAGDEILELFSPSAEDPANPKEHLDLSYDRHPIRASAGNKYEL